MAAITVANGNPNLSEGKDFYYAQGILYRRWEPKGPENQIGPIHQLVLPAKYRDTTLAIVHKIRLGRHLGKMKMTQRLLWRFYWPMLYSDVAKFVQLDSAHRVGKALLIPLPIISEPFHQIAMDIIGPLPRTTSGKRFILVVCNYATCYPEAVTIIDGCRARSRGAGPHIFTSWDTRRNPHGPRPELYVPTFSRDLHIPLYQTNPYQPVPSTRRWFG